MVKIVEEQLIERQADLARLELVAPADGTVMPPPHNAGQNDSPGQLKGWTGTPFSKKNIGATLAESTLFCLIGDPHMMEADMLIEQDDLEFVHKGQPVTIKLAELPHRTFHSLIVEVDTIASQGHAALILTSKAGGEAATKTDETGKEKPFNTSYEALAPIDNPEGILTNGLKGRAKISTSWQTLGRQARRYLSRTFNFRL